MADAKKSLEHCMSIKLGLFNLYLLQLLFSFGIREPLSLFVNLCENVMHMYEYEIATCIITTTSYITQESHAMIDNFMKPLSAQN